MDHKFTVISLKDQSRAKINVLLEIVPRESQTSLLRDPHTGTGGYGLFSGMRGSASTERLLRGY